MEKKICEYCNTEFAIITSTAETAGPLFCPVCGMRERLTADKVFGYANANAKTARATTKCSKRMKLVATAEDGSTSEAFVCSKTGRMCKRKKKK